MLDSMGTVSCAARRGEILEQKTDAYIGGVWYTIARNQMTYNTTGRQMANYAATALTAFAQGMRRVRAY